jgi:hypothetical protein
MRTKAVTDEKAEDDVSMRGSVNRAEIAHNRKMRSLGGPAEGDHSPEAL